MNKTKSEFLVKGYQLFFDFGMRTGISSLLVVNFVQASLS